MTTETRDHLKYTDEHEWIEVAENIATIGITDYAQETLGDLVYIELPEVGTKLDMGEQFAVAESVKAASEVYMPISGKIVEINEELEASPETVNSSPFDDGWLIKVEFSSSKEIDETMDASEYQHLVGTLE
jgi:glycine cleavage system H protein